MQSFTACALQLCLHIEDISSRNLLSEEKLFLLQFAIIMHFMYVILLTLFILHDKILKYRIY